MAVVFNVAGTVILFVGDRIVELIRVTEAEAVVLADAVMVVAPDVTTLTTLVTVLEPVVSVDVVVRGACTWPSVICETAGRVVVPETEAEVDEKSGLEMPNCEVYW